jgi:hypothetical protein
VRPLPLHLLAGCASTVAVDRRPGLDGRWTAKGTQLDVTGSTATVVLHGRILVFEGVSWLRGHVREDEVVLSGERLTIRLSEDRIVIASGKAVVDRPLASLPAGSRFVWSDGELKPR